MLAASLQVPSGGSIIAKLPFKKVGVRRIVISTPNANIVVLADCVPESPINNDYFEVQTS